MTENEKKWLAEVEVHKRKIIEEEQTRLNNLNVVQQSSLIFAHIFKIASKPRPKKLRKQMRGRLKRRAELLEQKYMNDVKSKLAEDKQNAKNKQEKSTFQLGLFYNYKSIHARKKVPEEILQSYVTHLKKRMQP
jgi:hypothetical protein